MRFSWKAFVAAFVAATVVNFVGVLFLLDPVARADTTPESPIVAAVSFAMAINVIIPIFNLHPMHGFDGEVALRVLPLFRDQINARRVAKDTINKLKK